MNLFFRIFFVSIVMAFSVTSFSVMAANAIELDPEQIKAFKKLSPAEKSALAKRFGVSMPAPEVVAAEAHKVQQNTVQQRNAADSESFQAEQAEQAEQAGQAEEVEDEDVAQGLGRDKNGLKRFGYELFSGSPTTFAPLSDVPVSSDYLLGPGDNLKINMYGKESQFVELVIDSEGAAFIPDLGPIELAGLTFSEAKQAISNTVNQKMIGVTAVVSMGQLKSIRVFVLGEAFNPGSYVVSSLSTVTNALLLSGGVAQKGSLRNIQIKRSGNLIATFDLYDLLLKGDTSKDLLLQSGDVVFIPPVGKTVGIRGEVLRPALYELQDDETVGTLLSMAGGLLATAHPELGKLERITDGDDKILIDLDLKTGDKASRLRDGDLVSIQPKLGRLNNFVTVNGPVFRPGAQTWREGMMLGEALENAGLKPEVDFNLAYLVRIEADAKMVVEELRLKISDIDSGIDKSLYSRRLNARDEIHLIDRTGTNRVKVLNDLTERLEAKKLPNERPPVVFASGNVKFESSYPWVKGLTARHLLENAVLGQDTDLSFALMIREKADLAVSVRMIDLSRLFNDDSYSGHFTLRPMDRLVTFSLIDSNRQEQVADVVERLRKQTSSNQSSLEVSIGGSVRYPGTYPLVDEMTVGQLIAAGGGMVEKAFLKSADLSRRQVDEKQNIAVQRLQIHLEDKKANDTLLQSRDVLFIRSIPNWTEKASIELSGEVNFPGTYSIYKNDTLSDVILRAGGITQYAYTPAALFTRKELREQQAQRVAEMKRKLTEDIAKAELIGGDSIGKEKDKEVSTEVAEAQKLLGLLDQSPVLGRLVIDLDRVLVNSSDYKIPVLDGDRLHIPTLQNAVTVIGEVQQPISLIYQPELNYREYVDKSGGTTINADEDRIYIVRASGDVVIPTTSSWFSSTQTEVAPGDTVVVPLHPEKVDQVVLWKDLSQIMYQIGLGAAAVGSL